MELNIKSYKEFCTEHKKYDGVRCCVGECDQPAYYEGGDARCWCPMCEEHADIKNHYLAYLIYHRRKVETRMKWDITDPTLIPLLKDIIAKIAEVKK